MNSPWVSGGCSLVFGCGERLCWARKQVTGPEGGRDELRLLHQPERRPVLVGGEIVAALGVGGESHPPFSADVALEAVGSGVEHTERSVVAEIVCIRSGGGGWLRRHG
jgi:hypothetical protein